MKMLQPNDLPDILIEYLDILYPDDEWKEWFFQKNSIFNGKSPQEILSVNHIDYPDKLRKNVNKLMDGFYRVFSFVGMNKVYSKQQMYDSIVESQKKMESRIY